MTVATTNEQGQHGKIDGMMDSFSDLFPSNWGEFGFDTLPLDSYFEGSVAGMADQQMSGAFKQNAQPDTPMSTSSDYSSTSLSPPTVRRDLSAAATVGKLAADHPVTKPRNGPGRIPRQRPKPQNLFQRWTQPQAPMHQQMMMPGMGPYGPTSPFLGMGAGSPMMAPADPYNWMHSSGMKRGYFGQASTSPSLLYTPFGNAMTSPSFGYQATMGGPQQYFPQMYQQPSVKLPVQAVSRPSEQQAGSEPSATANSFMAPLMLPADFDKRRSSRPTNEVDPAAIPSAITSFLGSGEAASGLNENLSLYEMTFHAFVEEEAKIDYGNVTVVELKRLLRKYQLAATGKKEELIKMVKDVAEFLKKLPLFNDNNQKKKQKTAAEADAKVEEKMCPSSISNAASANGKGAEDFGIERFLA